MSNKTPSKLTIVKNTQPPIQKYRLYVQLFFVAICIWIGIDFIRFVGHLEQYQQGAELYRPPGVEAFLPISALMSFVYFVQNGMVHPVHPAGFFIFAGIIIMSLVAGKSFCSWVCPVGFLSEYAGEFGGVVFRKKIAMPKVLDIPLRAVKYLLLGFFAVSVLTMSVNELRVFLYSDYNTIADIKLYEFFRNITPFAFYTLLALFALSLVFRNFWCRYLCPYGALLGLTGLLSPNKITRNKKTCIDCSLCDKACPSRIPVSKRVRVWSDECTSCMQCIDICPVNETLEYKVMLAKTPLHKKWVAAGLVIALLSLMAYGMLSGQWNNKIPASTYKEIYENREAVSH
jgi:ferredoxin